MTRSPIAALLYVATITAALADPVGSYDVEGRGPDGSNYRGTATIERQGDAYRMVWVIARERFVGTAVGNDEFLAVAYRSGNSTGIGGDGRDGDGWLGVWTYTGGREIGSERLTRR